MDFIKSRLMQDWIWFLSLIREQSFPGMLLFITDLVSSCAFKWSVLTFEIFFHLSSRHKYCFTATYDPTWQGVLKLAELFDRLPKYQILIKVLLTSSQLWDASGGPWSITKRDPKLIGFIWYVKLHGAHCENSLLPVSDGIIRLSPVLW